jgi:3-oxoisoapionate kinase
LKSLVKVDKDNNILLAFYGDDFTGSTDALEFLSRAGAKAVLFIEPPSPSQLANYPGLKAFGVAGLTRSMSPAQMEEVLLPAFKEMKRSGARHVHYKVCSTFDSSPAIGSIGKAIDVGATVFKNKFIPLLVAAPVLGRYCLFGNLFARMGIGSEGDIHRLDRHPSMSKHPVTPAEESDLRLQLATQTKKKTGLLDVTQLSKSKQDLTKEVNRIIKKGADILLIDAVYQQQLLSIGELIDDRAGKSTLFSVGSSGIEMALGAHWNQQEVLKPVSKWDHPGKSGPLLVISGSCSPVTAEQIEWAKSNDFEEVIVEVQALCNDDKKSMGSTIWNAQVLLQKGKNVIVHTNGAGSAPKSNLPSEKLGTALGQIAREIAAQKLFHRLVVAGGDTSSYAVRAMGIEAVQMIAPLVPGAPLCKAIAPGSPLNGMEVNFKGGQVGGETYFGTLLSGQL